MKFSLFWWNENQLVSSNFFFQFLLRLLPSLRITNGEVISCCADPSSEILFCRIPNFWDCFLNSTLENLCKILETTFVHLDDWENGISFRITKHLKRFLRRLSFALGNHYGDTWLARERTFTLGIQCFWDLPRADKPSAVNWAFGKESFSRSSPVVWCSSLYL